VTSEAIDEAPRYRLRASIEPFFAASGDVYLLRPGTRDEHVVRSPSDDDRTLLLRLAREAVTAPAGGHIASRIAPLVAAGVVVADPSSPPLGPREAERFDRQLPYLAELGDPRDVQRRLRAGRVVVLGCGGLGTWALGALASVGIGSFVLIDHDTIELSNLNRQILYGETDLGKPKVTVAAEWLRRFDATIQVQSVAQRVEGPGDLMPAITGADAVVLVADWPPYDLARWVNEACLAEGVPFITAGQQPPLVKIGPTYIPGRGACLVCHETAVRRGFPLYDELADYRRRDPPPATTLGPASGLVGTLLGLEVMHLLASSNLPVTHDRALLIDIGTLATRWESIERDPNCACCAGVCSP
jgi:bacteriocin biosynthesis cyclodehydratase domain-containing protein